MKKKKTAVTIDAALLQSARTVAKHLLAHPDEQRVRFLASLFAELCDGMPRAPRLPRDEDVLLTAAADRASVRGLICGMWRELVAHGALTPARAAMLASRIRVVVDEPAVCFVLAEEARTLECVDAAKTLLRDHAAFVARVGTLKIDRALVDALGLDVVAAGVTARWHRGGHLASLTKETRTLTLDARPGCGRYVEEGKRGGYGFAVRERYERGAARGTFNSPWHDGEDYQNEQPWLSWVSACMSTVLSG